MPFLPPNQQRQSTEGIYCTDYIIYLYMHRNFICGLSDVIKTFSQLVSGCQQNVSTPVERDGVVGFIQFCTIFPPHVWSLSLHIF